MNRTILRVDSSTHDDPVSVTRRITQAVVDALMVDESGLQLVEQDLARDGIDHLEGRPEADNFHLKQFLDADVIVIGAPMYNFAIPSQLKAWIDHILVAGQTFRYGPGGPIGLATGKRIIVATAAGGVPSQGMDFVEPYLKAAFGFIGIDDIQFIRAQGVAMDNGQAVVEGALQQAGTIRLAA